MQRKAVSPVAGWPARERETNAATFDARPHPCRVNQADRYDTPRQEFQQGSLVASGGFANHKGRFGRFHPGDMFEQFFKSGFVVSNTVTVLCGLHLQGIFGDVYGDEGMFF